MKSVRLLYPPDSVINLLQKLLKIKEYEILLVDYGEGIIRAVKKRKLAKEKILYIKVSKLDKDVTNIELILTVKSLFSNKAQPAGEKEETDLLNSIDNYF